MRWGCVWPVRVVEYFEQKFERSRGDAEKLMALASSENPVAKQAKTQKKRSSTAKALPDQKAPSRWASAGNQSLRWKWCPRWHRWRSRKSIPIRLRPSSPCCAKWRGQGYAGSCNDCGKSTGSFSDAVSRREDNQRGGAHRRLASPQPDKVSGPQPTNGRAGAGDVPGRKYRSWKRRSPRIGKVRRPLQPDEVFQGARPAILDRWSSVRDRRKRVGLITGPAKADGSHIAPSRRQHKWAISQRRGIAELKTGQRCAHCDPDLETGNPRSVNGTPTPRYGRWCGIAPKKAIWRRSVKSCWAREGKGTEYPAALVVPLPSYPGLRRNSLKGERAKLCLEGHNELEACSEKRSCECVT